MPLGMIEGALGGIGLFLLGMRIMSDGIRTVADDRIRSVFAALTSNRVSSMIFGMVLSLVLNSASAAVIFAIGLVNGGVLGMFQALSVLGGVLLGASLSLHLPWVPYRLVAAPLIFAGVLLRFFAHGRRVANVGNLLLGAGLLFLGLTMLEGSFRPSDRHPFYGAFQEAFFHHPLPALLFGGLISCFVQSALSTMNVILSLVSSYAVSDPVASVMVLGGALGFALVGAVASIGGTSVSRRTSLVFFLITLFVSLSMSVLASYLPALLQSVRPPDVAGVDHLGATYNLLSWVFTVAALLTAIIASILSGPVSRKIGAVEDHGGNGAAPQPCAGYLDARILNTPTLAIEQARKEIVRMTSVAAFMYADTRDILFEYDARRADTIRQHEQVLDSLNHEITLFLASLARSTTNPEISYAIPGLLQSVSDLEHMGDRCEDILGTIVSRKEAGVIFSDDAMNDLRRLSAVVATSVAAVESMLIHGTKPDEQALREIKTLARATFGEVARLHFERISAGVCPPRAAMLFNDLTSSFARIAELCWNIVGIRERTTP